MDNSSTFSTDRFVVVLDPPISKQICNIHIIVHVYMVLASRTGTFVNFIVVVFTVKIVVLTVVVVLFIVSILVGFISTELGWDVVYEVVDGLLKMGC